MPSNPSISPLINNILEQARWCPSPDNLQPWRFKIIDDLSFEIHCKDESDWMVYDINGHVTWLTIGFLLECIDISASAHSATCSFRQCESSNAQVTIFNVTLTIDSNLKKNDLYDFIPSRSVQRKPMGTKKLTNDEKTLLAAQLTNDFTLHWFETLSEKYQVAKLLYGNSTTRYTMKEGYDVHSKVIDWRKGYEQHSPTKIPPKSLGVDPITVALTKWALAKWERFYVIERYFAGTVWAKFNMDFLTAIFCSGHFLLTRNTTATTLTDFIDSGRTIMRLWLTCEKIGLGFQPEHTPVMFAELQRNGTAFSKDERATANAKKMDDKFKYLVGEQQVATSVYLARVGRSKPPTARSVRKELQELIIK